MGNGESHKSDKALDVSKQLPQTPRRSKGDFLTSKKRVEFADKNWNSFKTTNFYVISPFIGYVVLKT
ncbi:MAG: hypothetical protein ACKO7P_05205 [Bacteroidota bacterium]